MLVPQIEGTVSIRSPARAMIIDLETLQHQRLG